MCAFFIVDNIFLRNPSRRLQNSYVRGTSVQAIPTKILTATSKVFPRFLPEIRKRFRHTSNQLDVGLLEKIVTY